MHAGNGCARITSARLFFNSLNADKHGSLRVTDGKAAGTRQASTTGGPSGLYPSSFAALGNPVYFQGVDGAVEANLFKRDGASGVVSEVIPANASAEDLLPMGAMAYARKLYLDGYNAKRLTRVPFPITAPMRPWRWVACCCCGAVLPGRERGLFASNGTRLIRTGVKLVAGNTDTDAGLLPGTLTPAIAPGVASGSSVATGSASAGLPGDCLTVALLGDPAFPAGGSPVRINAVGAVLYQPGPIGDAQAGADLVRYAVTDAATRETVPATQSVRCSAARDVT